MNKKHYEKLARAIAANQNFVAKLFAAAVVVRLAQEDNPRFDEKWFMKECGLA